MKGNLKAIKKDGTAVLIETNGKEEWMNLAEWVKPEYAKKGPVNYEFNENTGEITFLKGSGYEPQGGSERKEKPKEPKTPENEEISRMSAVKASSRIYEATGDEQAFKKLSTEIVKYIKTGSW